MTILQAIVDGKTIQHKTINREWYDTNVASLDHLVTYYKDYRIKPEVKFRPFKDTEECWNEMQKHQPFGWVINKSNGRAYNIQSVLLEDGVVYIRGSYVELEKAFIDYTFADGTPFGTE